MEAEARADVRAGGVARMAWLLSFLALALSLSLGPAADRADSGAMDLLTRARLVVREMSGAVRAHPEVVLLALDNAAQERFGRFGAGAWLTRRPYLDQLQFFEQHLRPTVVGYDVIFPQARAADPLLRQAGADGRVETARALGGALAALAEEPGQVLGAQRLAELADFLGEQGNLHFMHRLAAVREAGAFDTVLAYSFRGGWVDPQTVEVPPWSPEEIADAQGRVEGGTRVPYLLDVRLPADCVTFARPADRETYAYAWNALLPSSELLDYARLGFINVRRDPDGVVRRIPLVAGFAYWDPASGRIEQAFVPSLPLLLCLLHAGVPFPLATGPEAPVRIVLGRRLELRLPGRPVLRVPVDRLGQMPLDFDVALRHFPSLSFAACAPSHLHATTEELAEAAARVGPVVRGRMVVVGEVATGAADTGPTPIDPFTPYVLVHLVAAHNLLQGRITPDLAPVWGWGLGGALFLAFSLLCARASAPRLVLWSCGIAVGLVLAAYIALHHQLVRLPLVRPLAYVGAASLFVSAHRFLAEERSKRRVRALFSTMVSPDVLRLLENNPGAVSMEGRTAETTILFSDLVEFTAMSERTEPEQVTRLMGEYLTAVTDGLLERGAYVDKFIGDAVMSVWGVPFPDPAHARRACAAVLDELDLLDGLRPGWLERYGYDVRVRYGIHSGTVVAGNMGSRRKQQYTVMGDAVNLAARLEPLNRVYGTVVIVSDATRAALGPEFVLRRLARERVRGRRQAADVYELVGRAGGVDDARLRACRRYEEALAACEQGEFSSAVDLLADAEQQRDPPSVRLLRLAREGRLPVDSPDAAG